MKQLSPAQLQLLREVERDWVWRSNWFPYDDFVERRGRYAKVNATTEALRLRGLIELGEEEPGDVRRRRYWRLTEGGRQALGVTSEVPDAPA